MRMVAGFVEIAERKEGFGCGGPIRTEYTTPIYFRPQRAHPLHCVKFNNDSS